MFELGLHVSTIWVVPDSYLQKYLDDEGIPYHIIISKEKLIEDIEKTEFDYFVSNGLPIILPISKLSVSLKKFINIHPSLLPDLRGRDPVPGAILFGHDSGATCHYMDDGIDTGTIISQVRIPMTDDLDAGLLYQLSFLAETEAFEAAFNRDFEPLEEQNDKNDKVYYSFHEKDLMVNVYTENTEEILAKVRAFATGNKGARIHIDKEEYIILSAKEICNEYTNRAYSTNEDGRVILQFENKIVIKIHNHIMELEIKKQEKNNNVYPAVGSRVDGFKERDEE